MVDLIIRRGRLYDPGQGLDMAGDLVIHHGKIVAIEKETSETGEHEVNAAGFFVFPGFIDVHTHVNWLGNYIGMPADLALIPNGVTATIDAGSSGVSNYESLFRYLDTCEVRSKIMIHASAGGQMMSKQFAENIDPAVWDEDLFERAFEKYGDRIIGIKLRVCKEVLQDRGLEPLKKAIQLAERFDTRVIIHSTNPPTSMADVCNLMRPGDIVAHMYHGEGNTILVDGHVDEQVVEAQKRGVIFDISQGKGNFSIPLAKQAVEEGFLPYTISTDLNKENWNSPLIFSLPLTMSKMLALGMKFDDVIKAVTTNAAKIYGDETLGTLKVGTPADISVFKLQEMKVQFVDKYSNTCIGNRILKPEATVVGGKLLYCSSETLEVRD